MAKHLARANGILAFDFINTIVDVKKVATGKELDQYAYHLHHCNYTGVWYPLELPYSWVGAPIFDDVIPGLYGLRNLGYTLVAFTNAPAALTIQWISRNSLPFQDIFPLEALKVFKPNQEAYNLLRDYYRVPHRETTVVTANRHFGDIEGADRAGMRAQLINRSNYENCVSPTSLTQMVDILETIDNA